MRSGNDGHSSPPAPPVSVGTALSAAYFRSEGVDVTKICLQYPSKRLLAITLTLLVGGVSAALVAQESSNSPSVSITPGPLITQAVDETHLTVLKGNTHRLARPEFDLGTAPAALPMERMLLVLKRSPEQEYALRKLLDDQQDKHSPNYHKWLTPTEFGKAFGPSDSDMQIVTSWLQSHGFQVGTTKGRTVLEFSGSASQVQEAFHSAIHKYIVNGEQHWANASDPSMPTALTPAVAGVLTLHNFLKTPQLRFSKEKVLAKTRPGKSPALTFSNGEHGLAPLDFAKIYDSPAFTGTPTGSGVTIGVVGRTNLYSVDSPDEDVIDFRSSEIFNITGGTFTVILNGPDPGDLGGGEEAEATLDSTWSGAVAPGANVDFVVSATTNTTDGVDLSEIYIIENNLADVMTESFGSCEAGNSGEEAGVSAMAEQAAAQGISYFVSTGDSGAEGCDDPNSETVATGPVSVNVLASTQFNTAVGGNVFNDTANPSLYWSPTNTSQESALSYIPQDVWNDSCLASSCGGNANISAGGGGASALVSKPSWQSGTGLNIPNDTARDLPDVSLSAAPHDGYVLCLEASCVPNGQGQFLLYLVAGTSASAPSFAGIMALVDDQMATLNPAQGPRQGQAGYVLYSLAASQSADLAHCNGSSTTLPASTCIFHDVTVGNNAVPGEVNYGLANAQYQSGAGYDLATGLGSVNITNLVTAWPTAVFLPTTTALTLNGATTAINVAHGTSVNVGVSVTPNTPPGTPTGDVALIASMTTSSQSVPPTAGFAGGVFTLSSGSVASATTQLPGGSYTVTAHYAGDGMFAPSDSASPGIPVTVTAESSTTTLTGPFTQDQSGQYTVPFTTTPFGSSVFLRADVKGASGTGTPTGTVTFSTTSGTIPNGSSSSLNSQGTASIQSNPFLVNGPTVPFDAGTYTISAAYGGDSSFAASASTQPVTFTVQPGFVAVYGLANVTIATPGGSGTTAVGFIASSNFTTAVSFTCAGLPSEAACTSTAVAGKGPNTIVNATITVTTTAAHLTQLQPNQRPYYFAVILGGGLPLAGIFLLAAPRRRRWSILLGLMLLALLVMVPACGGGGGSKTPTPVQDPGTPVGSYNVTVTATAGSISEQGSFTLTVQ